VQSANALDQKTIDFLDGFREQLAQNPGTLLTASGLVSTVSDLADVPGAPHLTPTADDVRAPTKWRRPTSASR
jgi:hypothetical protein